MSAFYVIVGIVVVSLVGITLVSAWERRLVWAYVPPTDVPPERFPLPNAYANAVAAAAAEAEFTPLGTFADGKGKIYRVRYDFFRSPAGDVLAMVGTGTIASLPVQTIWLYTLLADGRCLVTFDHPTGGEIDLAGIAEGVLVPNAGFAPLLLVHQARVDTAAQPVKPFDEVNPLGDFHLYRQSRVDRLVTLGYATYLDPAKIAWRYSVKGAVNLAFRQYFTGLRRAYVPDNVSAPRFVQKTAALLLLYVLLLLVNTLVSAFVTGHWRLLWIGVTLASGGFWLMGGLYQLKRWVWWVLTLGGVLLGFIYAVGLLADIVRLIKHLPLPPLQTAAVHFFGVFLLWPLVVRLLMRPSLAAFGLIKSVTAISEPPQSGVWPPPPSTPGGQGSV